MTVERTLAYHLKITTPKPTPLGYKTKPTEMIHVHPLNDIKHHDTSDTGNTCHCEPTVRIAGNEIFVIHNSFDGREGVEWANEILNNN
jgi:hypothetical protein